MEDKHFEKVFYFICALTIIVFVFDVGIVFIPIPKSGEKYADILAGSLNTAWVVSGINYLLGGSPKGKTEPTVPVTGDNTTVQVNPVAEEK